MAVAVVLPVGVGGAAIVTVGAEVKLLPTLVIITEVTALPATIAVAVAFAPPPLVIVTAGAEEGLYPDPPFVTEM